MRYLRIIMACLICGLLFAGPTRASTFTVINTNNSGRGSLDQAILDANANLGSDTIEFNIPGTGPHFISDSSLPSIVGPVVIDGFTEPGASANTNGTNLGINAVLMINLSGMLEVFGSNATIRGLAINSNPNAPGIELRGNGGHKVEGCFIGTNIYGKIISSCNYGVVVYSDNNTIGGTIPGARNLISGNLLPGIDLEGDGNYVQGNLIGTNLTGTIALGNGQDPVYDAEGIHVEGDNNTIGGGPGTRNVISGNTSDGIYVGYGTGNEILGNYIGTDRTGTVDLGNGGWGVFMGAGDDNIVGSTVAGTGNLISGNEGGGIRAQGGSTTNALIQNNFIGTDAAGTGALGNDGDGVYTSGSSVQVGGTVSSAGNVIAYNTGNGVSVGIYSTGVSIRRNTIHSNAGLGIDLGGDGVTPNDLMDPDTGANNLQNFPVFTVASCGSGLEISGSLNSTPHTQFTIEFFSSPSCDPSGHGEGAVFLGSTTVTTGGGTGWADIDVSVASAPAGHHVTAIAIAPNDDTSEFSQCVEVGAGLVVTNTNSSGPGSLFQACLNAEACAGLDTITFDIPGPGPHTIQVTTPLSVQTEPVVIDGYTQPGSSPNTAPRTVGTNAVLKIEIDGTNRQQGGGSDRGACFEIHGGNSIVRGLAINRFNGGPAVFLDVNGGNKVEGCFLGTDPSGTLARRNMFGVYIGSNSNTIGGITAMARNVISANLDYGVRVGGTGNRLFGNLIGTTASGTLALGNRLAGVYIRGDGNHIGGVTLASRNVISGTDQGAGIHLNSCDNNNVRGNYIGTNVSGSAAIGNQDAGVFIEASSGTWVGGTAAGFRNVISGNFWGVFIYNGSTGNVIAGNYIGTNAAGTGAVRNNSHGVWISSSNVNYIGGPSEVYRNVISGNNRDGVRIDDVSLANQVKANYIGTDYTGTNPLGNGWSGVYVNGANNAIGGAVAEANTIAFNVNAGVVVENYSANAIRRNSVFDNGGLGIDLGNDGVTLNDPGDPDTGANTLQNFPVLTSATGGTSSRIVGSLNSTANTSFTIDFFYSPKCDPSSHGEGKYLINSLPVGTNGSGNAFFDMLFSTIVPGGYQVTATATSSVGHTSEFSQCIEFINTKTGTNVVVMPVDEGTGETPVQIVFDEVTGEGNTTLEVTDSGPPVPGTYLVGDPPSFYHLSTTATYDDSILVCITYDDAALPGGEDELFILHYDTLLVPPDYVDITVSLDTLANIICGRTATLSPFVVAVPNPASGVVPIPEDPAAYALHQNVPNPFNPSTVIHYDVPTGGERVTLQIFDVKGRLIVTLVDAYETAGQNTVAWNGRDRKGQAVATGVYFCRMTAGSFVQTRKMVLMK